MCSSKQQAAGIRQAFSRNTGIFNPATNYRFVLCVRVCVALLTCLLPVLGRVTMCELHHPASGSCEVGWPECMNDVDEQVRPDTT